MQNCNTAGGKSAAASGLLAAAMMVWLAGPAFTQTIRMPTDFREQRADPVAGPRMGEPCSGCGVITAIREIQTQQPIPVPKPLQGDLIDRGPGASVPIGAVIALPDAGGRSYVGGVGTPEMRERFTQYTYQIVVKLDAGSETILERRDASRYRVGDRVRLQGIQLELLAP